MKSATHPHFYILKRTWENVQSSRPSIASISHTPGSNTGRVCWRDMGGTRYHEAGRLSLLEHIPHFLRPEYLEKWGSESSVVAMGQWNRFEHVTLGALEQMKNIIWNGWNIAAGLVQNGRTLTRSSGQMMFNFVSPEWWFLCLWTLIDFICGQFGPIWCDKMSVI